MPALRTNLAVAYRRTDERSVTYRTNGQHWTISARDVGALELGDALRAASSAMTLTSFSPPSFDEDHARFDTNVARQAASRRTMLDHRWIPP
jgi:hypothetical protein